MITTKQWKNLRTKQNLEYEQVWFLVEKLICIAGKVLNSGNESKKGSLLNQPLSKFKFWTATLLSFVEFRPGLEVRCQLRQTETGRETIQRAKNLGCVSKGHWQPTDVYFWGLGTSGDTVTVFKCLTCCQVKKKTDLPEGIRRSNYWFFKKKFLLSKVKVKPLQPIERKELVLLLWVERISLC